MHMNGFCRGAPSGAPRLFCVYERRRMNATASAASAIAPEPSAIVLFDELFSCKSTTVDDSSGKPSAALSEGHPKLPDFNVRITLSPISMRVVSSAAGACPAGLQVKVRSIGLPSRSPKYRSLF